MNRLKIEWLRKFVNRKHLDKERFGNRDLRTKLKGSR